MSKTFLSSIMTQLYKNKMGKFSFGKTFKSFDQYGEPIGMNYKG